MKKFWIRGVSWCIVAIVVVLKWTCRRHLLNDPRPVLRANRIPYLYAALHAHQIATLLCSESQTGALVSRSNDGQMIVPALQCMGVTVVRGSGRNRDGVDRGGKGAIDRLVAHVHSGKPGYIAVDGPRGPRGCVHMGIASLSERTDAVVIPIAAVPNKRWILRRAWDRMQIPLPFCRIEGRFGKPLRREPNESMEQFRRRIELSLQELEISLDPSEGRYASSLRSKRQHA